MTSFAVATEDSEDGAGIQIKSKNCHTWLARESEQDKDKHDKRAEGPGPDQEPLNLSIWA